MAPWLRASRSQLHIAAAAMQRHHQRPGAVGRVIFRHIEREAAAAAGFVVVVNDTGVVVGGLREPRQQSGVFAQGRIDEELAHRRQCRGQRIQRLLRAGCMAQRAKHGDQVAIAMLYRAQSLERGDRRIACGRKRRAQMCEFLRPIGQPRTDSLQRLIRRAGGFHDLIERRRVQMARDEAERFERLQQGRQHGHDVVHHGLAHRALPLFEQDLRANAFRVCREGKPAPAHRVVARGHAFPDRALAFNAAAAP